MVTVLVGGDWLACHWVWHGGDSYDHMSDDYQGDSGCGWRAGDRGNTREHAGKW